MTWLNKISILEANWWHRLQHHFGNVVEHFFNFRPEIKIYFGQYNLGVAFDINSNGRIYTSYVRIYFDKHIGTLISKGIEYIDADIVASKCDVLIFFGTLQPTKIIGTVDLLAAETTPFNLVKTIKEIIDADKDDDDGQTEPEFEPQPSESLSPNLVPVLSNNNWLTKLSTISDFYPSFMNLLNSYKGQGLFVHFTDTPKLGIKPTTMWTREPLGIYFFPLDFIAANPLKQTAFINRRYAFIVRITPRNVLNLSDSKNVEYWNYLRSGDALVGTSPPSAAEMRKELLNSGYDAVLDQGGGIIHFNEPYQILVLDPSIIQVVEMRDIQGLDKSRGKNKYPFYGASSKPAIELLSSIISQLGMQKISVKKSTSDGTNSGMWNAVASDSNSNKMNITIRLLRTGTVDYRGFLFTAGAYWHSAGRQIGESNLYENTYKEFSVDDNYDEVSREFVTRVQQKLQQYPMDDTPYAKSISEQIAKMLNGQILIHEPKDSTVVKKLQHGELYITIRYYEPEFDYETTEQSYKVSGYLKIPPKFPHSVINMSFHDDNSISIGNKNSSNEIVYNIIQKLEEVRDQHFNPSRSNNGMWKYMWEKSGLAVEELKSLLSMLKSASQENFCPKCGWQMFGIECGNPQCSFGQTNNETESTEHSDDPRRNNLPDAIYDSIGEDRPQMGDKVFEHYGVWLYPFSQVKQTENQWYLDWFDDPGSITDINNVQIGDKVADRALNMTPYWEVIYVDENSGRIYVKPIEPNPFTTGVGAGGKIIDEHDMEVFSGEYEKSRIDNVLDDIKTGRYTDPREIAYILFGTVPVNMGPNGAQGGWYNVTDTYSNRGGRQGMSAKEIMMKDAASLKKLGLDVPLSALDGTLPPELFHYVINGGLPYKAEEATLLSLPGENFTNIDAMLQFILTHPQSIIKSRNWEALSRTYYSAAPYNQEPIDINLAKHIIQLLKPVAKQLSDIYHPRQELFGENDPYYLIKENIIDFAASQGWTDILQKFETTLDPDNRTEVVRKYSDMGKIDDIYRLALAELSAKPLAQALYSLYKAQQNTNAIIDANPQKFLDILKHAEDNTVEAYYAKELLNTPMILKSPVAQDDDYAQTTVGTYINKFKKAERINWLHKLSQGQPSVNANMQILWHATIASHAENILEQNAIKPSLTPEDETGQSHAGWYFPDEIGEYGDGVYLAPNAESALYYAGIRLRQERDNSEITDEMDLYEDDMEYLGLFRIFIGDLHNLVSIGNSKDEFKYRGVITGQKNPKAYYEWIGWVSRTRDAEKWRNKLINDDLDPVDSDNDTNAKPMPLPVDTPIQQYSYPAGARRIDRHMEEETASEQFSKYPDMKYLGQGQIGVVYSLGNTVIKYTQDWNEAEVAMSIRDISKNESISCVVKIHSVEQVQRTPVIWGIIAERVDTLSQEEAQIYGIIAEYQDENFEIPSIDELIEYIKTNDVFDYIRTNSIIDFYNEYNRMINCLLQHGIDIGDVHEDNIGKDKNGLFVLLDLGIYPKDRSEDIVRKNKR